MFRNCEEEEKQDSHQSDYQLDYLEFWVHSVGAVFSGSKKSYHWNFCYQQTGVNDGCAQSRQYVTINLIDSCYSHKKTLIVNKKKIIEKEKIQQFGKTPFHLTSDMINGNISVQLRQDWDSNHDYEVVVAGVTFTELQKRMKKLEKGGCLELNAPITDGDANCDYSVISSANLALLKLKIDDAAEKAKLLNQE